MKEMLKFLSYLQWPANSSITVVLMGSARGGLNDAKFSLLRPDLAMLSWLYVDKTSLKVGVVSSASSSQMSLI